FLRSISKPVTMAFLGIGLNISRGFVVFAKTTLVDQTIVMVSDGLNPAISDYWNKISLALIAFAFSWAAYKLVDIVDFYMCKLTSRTETKLDDMLVPVVRKSLRATIAIIAVLWIADGILELKIKAILLSAGVGGIAIALAAKDTVANFFGSITIFADRPFQIDDLVKIGDCYGQVEEVGFRSTKIRTLEGHLITVPNSQVANSMVDNVSKRPFIRRTSNITITYDAGPLGAQKAVEIIKDTLKDISEVNTNKDYLPRVYFNEFNDCSLNIYMSYWVKPTDWWLFNEVNERVNLEMMKRFAAEGIEFAFPTQTLYLKNEPQDGKKAPEK
nr:mechanosensitive ion channel family protein [Planctomycetota bacterium]